MAAKMFSSQEVSKHNTKEDCWVVLNGKVLDVTHFLKDHPGGELSIVTFAGKDASAEFNMIHPEGVVEKYAPNTVIGETSAEDAEELKKGAGVQKKAANGEIGCFASFISSICGN